MGSLEQLPSADARNIAGISMHIYAHVHVCLVYSKSI